MIHRASPAGAIGVSDALQTAAARLLELFQQFLASRRRSAEARRLSDALASLSDASLLDIGVAEEEIYRVRNLEQFTPLAWCDGRGHERCCGA